ncbi:MAG: thiamine pyrophosphate-dependent enzyme [candidate division WOR-3 bacterium]
MISQMEKKFFSVHINKNYCKRCGICINICPKNVLDADPAGFPRVIDEDACINCKQCENHCPDFAIWVTDRGVKQDIHPLSDYLRLNHMPSVWCPGCGIGMVFQALLKVISKSGLKKDDIAMISGIGCTGRMPGYADFNTLHTTHGRALAFATGLKLANPDLKVITVMGDGDAYAIGGNHFLHAAKRNVDIVAVVVNNYNYGMTGGQASPTTPLNAYTTTTPYGNMEPSFDGCAVAAAAGANFVARSTVYHVPLLEKLLEKAMKVEGFALVEVLSPCPTYYGRLNLEADAFKTLDWYKKITYMVGTEPKEGAFIPIGVLAENNNKSYLNILREKWREIKSK